jgi:multiple antibiotic resistance protein
MGPAHFAVNFFVALFALIDPVGATPLFAAATAGARPSGQRLTAAYIALFAFGFLAFFFVSGLWLLRFFGIGLAAFRIAGGALLFLLGLDMARGTMAANLADAADAKELSIGAYARREFERLVVPFAMPLLIGPGAISTVVIYAGEARKLGFAGELAGIAVIAAIALSIVATFWFTGLITLALGRIGTIIVIRVLGLILCALAVQFMLAGLADSTVGVMGPTAATPYPAGAVGK